VDAAACGATVGDLFGSAAGYWYGTAREPAGYGFCRGPGDRDALCPQGDALYFESIDRGAVTLARFDREWTLPTYKIARLLIIAFAVVSKGQWYQAPADDRRKP
jgi:hypothetical protein